MGIILFSFKLVHVSMLKHKGIDGLSRRLPVEEDPMEDSDYEDWIDRAYLFSITLLNNHTYCIYGRCVDILLQEHPMLAWPLFIFLLALAFYLYPEDYACIHMHYLFWLVILSPYLFWLHSL
jgi:hypothetical protein